MSIFLFISSENIIITILKLPDSVFVPRAERFKQGLTHVQVIKGAVASREDLCNDLLTVKKPNSVKVNSRYTAVLRSIDLKKQRRLSDSFSLN